MNWGLRLLVFGAAMAIAAAAPGALVFLLPGLGEGFLGLLAMMLLLSVAPLGVMIASVGAIVLLVSALRRARPSRGDARGP